MLVAEWFQVVYSGGTSLVGTKARQLLRTWVDTYKYLTQNWPMAMGQVGPSKQNIVEAKARTDMMSCPIGRGQTLYIYIFFFNARARVTSSYSVCTSLVNSYLMPMHAWRDVALFEL